MSETELIDFGSSVVVPRGGNVDDVLGARPLRPFAPEVIDFLGDLSEAIRASPTCRQFADVVAFAFWIRRPSLARLERKADLGSTRRLGRGVVFHVSPTNVPVNFAFSLVAGLLAGNANIVRVPSAEFPQVRAIADVLNAVLERDEHQTVRKHVLLVRYDKSMSSLTERLSRECDVRVIWGGDGTIADIRRHQLGARAFDITFADRFSVCLIGASSYLKCENVSEVARRFYNDTYLFDQNACTAPHLVFWWGSPAEVEMARECFWSSLQAYALFRYEVQPVSAVGKLTKALLFAATHPGTRVIPRGDNLLLRVELGHELPDLARWRGDSGLFFERQIGNLTEIIPFINRQWQTLAYLGVDPNEISDVLVAGGVHGVDRVVPVGRTLDFDLSWDGHDLVRSMSRVVFVS